MKIEIEKISLVHDFVNNEREIKVNLSTGSEVTIIPCHESYEQYGGTLAELQVTCLVAEQYNAWLHGDDNIE